MSDTTSMYRTSQQIGNGEPDKLLFFCVVEFTLLVDSLYFLFTFTPQRSFAEYWKHFVARFNDVHASGYNSAGSVRIQMKFGAL